MKLVYNNFVMDILQKQMLGFYLLRLHTFLFFKC